MDRFYDEIRLISEIIYFKNGNYAVYTVICFKHISVPYFMIFLNLKADKIFPTENKNKFYENTNKRYLKITLGKSSSVATHTHHTFIEQKIIRTAN